MARTMHLIKRILVAFVAATAFMKKIQLIEKIKRILLSL